MDRFLFRHERSDESGFAAGIRFGHYGFLGWLGYGKPVWWKPRFFGKKDGLTVFGFGFGWLLLCFQVQIVELRKEA